LVSYASMRSRASQVSLVRSPSVLIAALLACALFFKYTAPTQIYTLSLHDALPISTLAAPSPHGTPTTRRWCGGPNRPPSTAGWRSEEHTSELQSLTNLVCRLLLEKKKNSECLCSPSL